MQNILPRVRDRRVVTYGFSAQADVRGVNVTPVPGGNRFECIVRERDGTSRSIEISSCRCPAATTSRTRSPRSAWRWSSAFPTRRSSRAFARSAGVKRRFTNVGEVERTAVTIIDDYGHHPVEIRAVLAAAREGAEGRVIAVVQPHRYSRLAT